MRDSLPGVSLLPLQVCARGLAMSWRETLGNTTFSQEADLEQKVLAALHAAAVAEFERQRAAATGCGGGL